MRVLLCGFSRESEWMVEIISDALKNMSHKPLIPHYDFPVDLDTEGLLRDINIDLVIIVGFSNIHAELGKEIVVADGAIVNDIPFMVIECAIGSSMCGEVKRIARKANRVFVSLRSLLHTANTFGYPFSTHVCTLGKIKEKLWEMIEKIEGFVSIAKSRG